MAVTNAEVTRVASSASAVELKAANRNRRGITIYNESTANLYIKCGQSATTSDYTVMVPPSGYVNFRGNPIYVGLITGVWATANGAAQITEFYG
jgi:hypothetical protein